ncbi:MAG: LytR C-terminal domain-containing protein [Microthrixaceae bacterium]
MATTQRPRTPRRSGPPPGPDPASRGLILVGVGVVVGIILLLRGGGIGFDSSPASVEVKADAGSTTTVTTASTTTVPTTDKAPQTVKVVVANGSTVQGLASKTAQFLAQSGYTNNVATDAETQTQVTTVFFATGFESNAKAIARQLGLSDSSVQALPPGAKLAKNQPADAGVIVITGPEVAATVGATASTTVAGTGTGTGTSTTIAGTGTGTGTGTGSGSATTTTVRSGTGGATTSLPRTTTTSVSG